MKNVSTALLCAANSGTETYNYRSTTYAATHYHSRYCDAASVNRGGGSAQLSVEWTASLQEAWKHNRSSPVERMQEAARRAQMHRDKQDYAKAMIEQEMAVDIAKTMETRPEFLIDELTSLGIIYVERYRSAKKRTILKARKIFNCALQLGTQFYGPEDGHLASILDELASVHSHLGNNRKAFMLYGRALSILRRDKGADSYDVAAIEADVASIHFFWKKYKVAEDLLRHVAAVVKAAPDPDNRQLPCVFNNLALVVTGAGREAEGVMLMKQALRLETAIHGSRSPELICRLQNLGGLHAIAGRWREAEQSYRRAIALSNRRKEQDAGELKQLNRDLKAIRSRRWTRQVAFFLQSELDRGYTTTHPDLQ